MSSTREAIRTAIEARYVRLSMVDLSTVSEEDRAWWHFQATKRGMRYVNGREEWFPELARR